MKHLFNFILSTFIINMCFSQNTYIAPIEIGVFENSKGLNLVCNKAIFTTVSAGNLKEVVIFKQLSNGKYKQLGKILSLKNWDGIESKLKAQEVEHFLKLKKITSKIDAWKFICDSPIVTISAYSTLMGNPNFLEATGIVWNDIESSSYAAGETINYKVIYKTTTTDVEKTTSYTVVKKAFIEKPTIVKMVERDSIINIVWGAKKSEKSEALIGQIFRKTGSGGKFLIHKKVLASASTKNDSVYYFFAEKVTPVTQYSYFIQTLNKHGIKGETSDTVTAIAINFNKVSSIKKIQLKDTLNGLLLTWDSIKNNQFLAGLIIKRSLANSNFFEPIDTIAAVNIRYLDTKLKPYTQYFYTIELLTIRQNTISSLTKIPGLFKAKGMPIEVPINLSTKCFIDSIAIFWIAKPIANVYAYYVYRSTAIDTNWQKVSDEVYDTHFTDTTVHNSNILYKYSVRSVSYAGNQSDYSSPTFGKVLNKMKPIPVLGIKGYNDISVNTIIWQPVYTFNNDIIGYRIYKKNTGNINDSSYETISSDQLYKKGYIQISQNDSLLQSTFSDDNLLQGFAKYTVTAISNSGGESDATQFVSLYAQVSKYLPIDQFYIYQEPESIKIEWPSSYQNGILGYKIFRKELTSNKTEQLAIVPTTENTFIDKTAQKGKIYFYSIQVFGKNGESVRSIERRVLLH